MFDFWNGIFIGLVVSAPLGPIGILCLNYAFSHGFRLATLAGLGAAIADTTYAVIAGFGLTFVSEWLLEHYLLFGLFGGSFLIFLGYKIFTAPPIKEFATITHGSELQALFSTFLFTISNPLTVMVFATLFGCLATAEGSRTTFDTSCLVIGVFLGSMIWWTFLSFAGSYLRSKVDMGLLNTIRKAVAIGIMGFGAGFMVYMYTL